MRYPLLCALLLLSALSVAARPSDLPDLVRDLGDEEWGIREMAFFKLLEQDSDKVTPLLKQAVTHEDAEIRFRARQLLLLRKYKAPYGKRALLLPLLEEFERIPPEETTRRMELLIKISESLGLSGLPTLVTFMGEADPILAGDIFQQIAIRLDEVRRLPWAQAREVLDKTFTAYTDYFYSRTYSPEYAQRLGRLLAAYIEQHLPDKYRVLLFVLTELGDAPLGLILAKDLYREQEFEQMREVTAMLKPESEEQIYLTNYMRLLAAQKPAQEEAALLDELRGQYPDKEEVHAHAADFLKQTGRSFLAEEELQLVLSIEPDNTILDVNARFELAHNQYQILNYKQAAEEFKQCKAAAVAAGQDTSIIERYIAFSEIWDALENGRPEECREQLMEMKTSLNFQLENSDFQYLEFEILLGRYYLKTGRLDKKKERAGQLYRHYLLKKPGYTAPAEEAKWNNNTAWYLSRVQEMPDIALACSGRSLEIEPDTAMYLDTMAECRFAAGDPAKAIDAIEKAITHHKSKLMLVYYTKQLKRFKQALAAQKTEE